MPTHGNTAIILVAADISPKSRSFPRPPAISQSFLLIVWHSELVIGLN